MLNESRITIGSFPNIGIFLIQRLKIVAGQLRLKPAFLSAANNNNYRVGKKAIKVGV